MQLDANLVFLSVLIAIVASHATLEWIPLLDTLKRPQFSALLVSLLFGLARIFHPPLTFPVRMWL